MSIIQAKNFVKERTRELGEANVHISNILTRVLDNIATPII